MIPAAALLLVAAGVAAAKSLAPGVFDQRQDGRVNVQIDVKDVQIVALLPSDVLEDYMSYDYMYDYADFTIKPRPTPSRPTSSSTEASVASTTTTITTTSAAAETSPASPAAPASPGEEASPIAQPSTIEPLHASSLVPAASEPRKRCPVGFHLKSGRCFKRRQSMISPRFALMKLAPTLLDKTKAWSRQPAAESS